MRTHGSERRSRATWSRRCVSSFSRASSLLRSVSHCSRDTTGWFVMLDLPMVVFMMCSWKQDRRDSRQWRDSGFSGFALLDLGLGRVAKNEGSELPLERLGCTIAPAVRDRLGCRIGEDVLLAPLESIEYPARRGLGRRLRDVEAAVHVCVDGTQNHPVDLDSIGREQRAERLRQAERSRLGNRIGGYQRQRGERDHG